MRMDSTIQNLKARNSQDQAARLRSLVLRAARPLTPEATTLPSVVVLFSGNANAGVSLCSSALSEVFAHDGYRTAVLDLSRCQDRTLDQNELNAKSDWLRSDADPHESIEDLGGGRSRLHAPALNELQYEIGVGAVRRALSKLGKFVDLLVVDLGTVEHPLSKSIVELADVLVGISLCTQLGYFQTYGRLKRVASFGGAADRLLLLNRVQESNLADEVALRLQVSAKKFLHQQWGFAGALPEEGGLASCGSFRIDQKALVEFGERLRPEVERLGDQIERMLAARGDASSVAAA